MKISDMKFVHFGIRASGLDSVNLRGNKKLEGLETKNLISKGTSCFFFFSSLPQNCLLVLHPLPYQQFCPQLFPQLATSVPAPTQSIFK